MSRLEKAREEKRKKKKKSRFIFLLFLLVVAALIVFYIYYLEDILNVPEETVSDVLDSELSTALIDIFDLTYVRIYILEGLVADEIRANGVPLERNIEENRWEVTLPDLQAGSEVFIVVIVDSKVVEEKSLIIEDL